jgi:hypothetical protein
MKAISDFGYGISDFVFGSLEASITEMLMLENTKSEIRNPKSEIS